MVFVWNHPFSCCLLPFPAETSPRHHAQTHKPCLEQNAIPADYIDVCPRVEKCRHNILFLHLSGQRQCGLFALRHCRHISGIFETEMANPASSRSLQLGSASRASSSATIFRVRREQPRVAAFFRARIVFAFWSRSSHTVDERPAIEARMRAVWPASSFKLIVSLRWAVSRRRFSTTAA